MIVGYEDGEIAVAITPPDLSGLSRESQLCGRLMGFDTIEAEQAMKELAGMFSHADANRESNIKQNDIKYVFIFIICCMRQHYGNVKIQTAGCEALANAMEAPCFMTNKVNEAGAANVVAVVMQNFRNDVELQRIARVVLSNLQREDNPWGSL